MINDCFIHESLAESRKSLCASINDLLAFARRRQFSVFWVRQEFDASLCDAFTGMKAQGVSLYIRGTTGPQLLDEFTPIDEEYEIIKKRYSMFFGTELDDRLTKLNPSELILAGVNTHACIRMAALDAFQRDYKTSIIEECVDSYDKVHHRISLDYLNRGIATVMSLADLKAAHDA